MSQAPLTLKELMPIDIFGMAAYVAFVGLCPGKSVFCPLAPFLIFSCKMSFPTPTICINFLI
jgi:hypothetical protein